MAILQAPFTPDQVASLNAYQDAEVMHPFTCGGDHGSTKLVATPEGWICPECPYKQNWAHDWMANRFWESTAQPFGKLRG